MVDKPGHNACCPACGHPIDDPMSTYRCPGCGSYDVAMLRAVRGDADPAGDSSPRLIKADEEPIALASVYPLRFLLPRPPRGIPRACWERVRRLRSFLVLTEFIWFGCLLGLLLLDPLDVTGFLDRLYDHLWYPALFLSVVGGILSPRLLKRAVRRLEKEIQSNNLEHCLECGYPLRGLPTEHRCPECGEPYDIAAVRRTWERYFEAQKGIGVTR